ncbi:carbohydrate ABC transporter substrate-binding protein [Mobilitalea sibirica]|uniref:Carbohydrate ABC transporter substrate-binding protein n=1 Tax=Mobilitalea sibirica TaxID=1462919 RepID=A0A8J7H0J4_9FIRM|nr:ABC transporter substrate-binding protein [Mobilitalea sibirica]MBH1939602.1 carbohydrate ABC transporter substrate-binding protein [Mobilitalea sibirica]
MKKKISIIMSCLLLLLTLSGCSNGGKGETEEENITVEGKIAMGRYVEETIDFPKEVDPDDYISLTVTPYGIIELYTYKNFGSYEKYVYTDKEWTKENADELQGFNRTNTMRITDVFYGEDGRQYLLGNSTKYKNVLYRLSDQGEYEKLEIKKFEEKYAEYDMYYRPLIIKVLKNGMIAASYLRGEIEVYSSDGQSVIAELTSSYDAKFTVEENNLYYTSQNKDELFTIDMETKEEGTPRAIEIDLSNIGILEYDSTTAYFCDTSGIHLNKEGSSLWETIVDGNQSSLNMPSLTLSKFIVGAEDDFYCVYQDINKAVIKYLYYDENLSTIPSVELSIFSLTDSKTIRQAIAMFREKHPDVFINYRVAKQDQGKYYTYGIEDPEQTVTDTDYIKTLNTELLASKGADILVLDGLPVDSYIEKGVLEDMGSIFTPMLENGELIENIADNYIDDGKVYAMPVRFKFPIIYGNAEAVNFAGSIKELADYTKSNQEIPLLYESNYRALAAWFLLIYYDQILNDKNVIDEGMLQDLLEAMNIIASNIGASNDATLDHMNKSIGHTVFGYWVGAMGYLHKKLIQSNIALMNGIADFAIPLEATRQWKGTYNAMNHTYVASALIGINSAGKQKELAKEFIHLLFSEEVQSFELEDGFPLNTKAMDGWIQRDQSMGMSILFDDGYTIVSDYPTSSVRKKIYEIICSLSKPMMNDTTMLNMILDEAERYLRGDITAEQAAKNAVSSINTYLNE